MSAVLKLVTDAPSGVRVGFDGKSGYFVVFSGRQAVISFSTKERAERFAKEFNVKGVF